MLRRRTDGISKRRAGRIRARSAERKTAHQRVAPSIRNADQQVSPGLPYPATLRTKRRDATNAERIVFGYMRLRPHRYAPISERQGIRVQPITRRSRPVFVANPTHLRPAIIYCGSLHTN